MGSIVRSSLFVTCIGVINLVRPSVFPLVAMSSLPGTTQLSMQFEPVELHRRLRPVASPFFTLRFMML